jgi:DNA-directed RNA polymerase subunit RPC12/RpoP
LVCSFQLIALPCDFARTIWAEFGSNPVLFQTTNPKNTSIRFSYRLTGAIQPYTKLREFCMFRGSAFMAIKLTCPECGKRMTMNFETTTVYCPECGYRPSTGLDERAEQIRAKGPRPEVSISNEKDINIRAVSLFDTAQDYLFQDKKAEALRSLQEAIDLQPDFLDAHLWIAKISDDEQVKRDHLGSVLAYDPGHTEAMRMLLVLNGRLTPEQAARTYDDNDLQVQRAEAPVTVETATLKCPKCKGDLTVDDATGNVKCRFCGYTGIKSASRDVGAVPLVAGMLQRKAQAVKWVVGERLLECDECGASRTITGNQLSARCPFCGSNHVIEKDALGSFEQPEGLIPFKISRDEAGARIKEHLKTFSERVKGWFDSNKVSSATLNGYYLPFWLFDATVEISRTVIANNPSGDRNRRQREPYQRTTLNDALYDVEICAVKSPPPELMHQLGDYQPDEIVAYTPELLAKYPAQLYTLDVDRAALDAHSIISNVMRSKHNIRESGDVSVSVFSNIQQMSFRLVLTPVWIAQLVEVDKDHRVALVNGQTGKVVLGKTEKHQ